ncbi:MAG: cobyrinic acid a,c-diamide synthase [Pseudonocardiales bacterium]|nr:cobyrinic acid a,c-diamide synthase [Pseudonocardiales bacterium]
MVTIPRVVVAAPASGSGKTSVATGLLAAFRARGLIVSPHKVGPDYIDPGYHGLAAGRPGRNLDPWLVGEPRVAQLFAHGASTPQPADVAVVEGVMGLFDGAIGMGIFASTAHVAELLQAPVILVVDTTGMGGSVAALVHGFLTFRPDVRIGGVILNQVGSGRHAMLLARALEEAGVPTLGAIHRQDELATPSRHLGLVPAAERTAAAEATVAALGRVVADSVDLDAVLALARSAPPLDVEPLMPGNLLATSSPDAQVRVAVAAGAAFTFGYAEHVELLHGAGAEVVMFDPITDASLPADIDGVVIGGGFPEAYAEALSDNESMRRSVAGAVRGGVPVAAECAGLLYLANHLDRRPMCGVLDADAVMTPRLTLGYREAVAATDSVLALAGTRVRGHEFHRTACTPPAGAPPAWHWRAGEASVSEGFAGGNVHASYLHLHWVGVPGIADRFVAACAEARDA